MPLDPATVRALRDQRRRQAEERLLRGSGWRDHDLVFAKVEGSPLDPERVSREFQRRIERWKLRRIRLHDRRHTWATLALKAGAPVKVVQREAAQRQARRAEDERWRAQAAETAYLRAHAH